MKINNKNYIKASINVSNTTVEIESIIEFTQFIDNHNIKDIFITPPPSSSFFIIYNHAILVIASANFLNLEDYKNAIQNNFNNSIEYYHAKELQIENYEDYEMISKFGIKDLDTIQEMKSEGYIEGFNHFINLEKETPEQINEINNAYQLYEFGKSNGYSNFDELYNTFKQGFSNRTTYNLAIEKGFNNATEYFDALENGFSDYNTFYIAKSTNVKTYAELITKINLETINPSLAHDKSLLLSILSKLDQKKKVSLNKLISLLNNTIEEQYTENNTIYQWFKKELTSQEDVVKFLESNENAIKFGNYDTDGEYFEVHQLQDRSIILDGSNVAHNSNNGMSEKPSIENIITMVKFLKQKGFQEIIVISDASLKHKVIDYEKKEALEKIATHLVAPAGTAADVYLISYVKENYCLLVSNDTFKQYKLSDAWTALNIDFYRLTFIIKDNNVFMPDLK
jgi:Zc3h12a-like Ribonuclease NYN domain